MMPSPPPTRDLIVVLVVQIRYSTRFSEFQCHGMMIMMRLIRRRHSRSDSDSRLGNGKGPIPDHRHLQYLHLINQRYHHCLIGESTLEIMQCKKNTTQRT